MSRSGYSDDCDDNLAMGRWRGVVKSATNGKRGQKLFTDLLEALDAMPVKRLITNELKSEGGFCTLGVLGQKRGIEMDKIDPEDYEAVAKEFDIAAPLAQEIVYMNDEYFGSWNHASITPEDRWASMRAWVQKQIKTEGVKC